MISLNKLSDLELEDISTSMDRFACKIDLELENKGHQNPYLMVDIFIPEFNAGSEIRLIQLKNHFQIEQIFGNGNKISSKPNIKIKTISQLKYILNDIDFTSVVTCYYTNYSEYCRQLSKDVRSFTKPQNKHDQAVINYYRKLSSIDDLINIIVRTCQGKATSQSLFKSVINKPELIILSGTKPMKRRLISDIKASNIIGGNVMFNNANKMLLVHLNVAKYFLGLAMAYYDVIKFIQSSTKLGVKNKIPVHGARGFVKDLNTNLVLNIASSELNFKHRKHYEKITARGSIPVKARKMIARYNMVSSLNVAHDCLSLLSTSGKSNNTVKVLFINRLHKLEHLA